MSTTGPSPSLRRARNLTQELVDALGDRVRDGRLPRGSKLPTEAEIMAEFGVSRTVVREAISRLQAAGTVQTRHGIGTFVVGLGEGGAFHIRQQRQQTLRDVIAVLELRIGIETEGAALAAQRRTLPQLTAMRQALDAFKTAVDEGRDAVGADFQFHLEIARATQNEHFVELLGTLGVGIIPRARLEPGAPPSAERRADQERVVARPPRRRRPPPPSAERRAYLERVNAEHESILDAIAACDAEAARAAMRTHLANSKERRRRGA